MLKEKGSLKKSFMKLVFSIMQKNNECLFICVTLINFKKLIFNHMLKVALLQTDLVWENIEQNLIRFSEKINGIEEQIDLILLPEMFSTGFSMKPQNLAETMDGTTVNWMLNLATKKNVAIAGSAIIKENEAYYNRFLFVKPTGEVEYYDKRHLFTLAGEDKVYTSGNKKIVINYKGFKICPLICYDLRFPVWARNIEAYDVLIYVANWPKPRIAAWDALLKARAIENMCFTIGLNRVGKDANNLEYNGHSAVYNCLGEKMTGTIENVENTIVVSLNKKHITEVRSNLNFLNDKDVFVIK